MNLKNNLKFITDSKNNFLHKSLIDSAFILHCLHSFHDKETKKLKKEIADFLLSKKNQDWTFSSEENKNYDLGNTFLILSVLNEYDPKIIDGEAIANILNILTSHEAKEGGPYYTSLNNNKIDLSVNVFIALFLSYQEVDLPELNKLIETALDENDFQSDSPFLIMYFISCFYAGDKKEKIINFLENKKWDNIIDTSLAILTLINLGADPEKYKQEINHLNEQTNKLARQSILDHVWSLKALTKIQNLSLEKNVEHENFSSEELAMYEKIISLARKNLALFDNDLQEKNKQALERIIKADKDKQIALLPFWFKQSLKEKQNNIPDDLIINLGLANVYLWIAYTIYDDFLDEEGDPALLSSANVCLREFVIIFEKIMPANYDFHKFFQETMNTLDAANAWEIVHCRAYLSNNTVYLQSLPDYNNFKKLCERSIAHALGPITILFYLGYSETSEEVKQTMMFFKNYLIARQMNDDAHDWEEDLQKGHINSVMTEIIKKSTSQEQINLENDLKNLQEIFWFDIIKNVSVKILDFVNLAQINLKSLDKLLTSEKLKTILTSFKNSATKALDEQKSFAEFLDNY